jgi:AcrR family transcriptional regulator
MDMATLDSKSPSEQKRRGRPVSSASRAAALSTATRLLSDHGLRNFSIDDVARASGVGKATIYRHWAGRLPLAVEAFGELVTAAVPIRESDDVVQDLVAQAANLAGFYASDLGAVATQIIAAAALEPGGEELVRKSFFSKRRAATAARIERGKTIGQLTDRPPTELTIDAIFGPIMFRLFNGEGPLTQNEAAEIAETFLIGIKRPEQ